MCALAKDIGIDLGTANTLVFMKGKGIIMREPSVVAVDTRNYTVKYVGQEAKDVIGRTPGSIVTVRPLKDGVIADFDITASMLQIFIKKACNNSIFARPRVVICIPSGVTAVERRAVKEASLKAGARHVAIIEEPMAAAIGAGLPVAEATGSMVVDIGGGTSEVAVISLGGIVASRSVRVGGDEFDSAIIQYVKKKYNLLIGDRTAEEVKLDLGSALPLRDERRARIRGRDMVTNLPQTTEITSTQIYEALHEPCMAILGAIKWVLERTPPELAADIMHNGVYLTGGGSLLYGMDQLIASELGIPVLLSKEPMDCAALGLGNIIENYELLEHLGRTSFLKPF